ncbi:hypothetical protein F4805DRAFT_456097 [Annulohypoxylon moriforme]|nr:hypothetical protein F4805DRAFT_456097 [Annulohypoxylon moriforme]
MDGGSEIFSRALRCHKLFLKHGKKDDTAGSIPFTRVLRECHYRFNAWTSYLGVFAAEPASLDSRLKDATEVKDLVIDILESINDNLQLSLEPSQHHDDLLLSDPAAPLGSGELWEHSQIQNSIQRLIDRLERLGIAIRQSSTVNLQQRVEIFTKKKAKASFEELSLQIVRSMYPDADEDIISFLGRSIFLRYAKLRYKHEHQKKLALHRRELFEEGLDLVEERVLTPAPNPITALVGTRPDEPLFSAPEQPPDIAETDEYVAEPLLSDTVPSVFQGEIKPLQAPSQKTSSIIVRGATYPKPPTKESAPELKTCGWCFEIYKTTQFDDYKWWVRHVDRDLLPYICLSEDCMEPMVQFERFEQWNKHMKEKHTLEWTEKVYARKWICDADHISPLSFDSLRLLKTHMNEFHADLFDDVQLKVLAEQSAVQAPRDPGTCPLCCFSVVENDQEANENQGLEDGTPLIDTTKPGSSGKGKGIASAARKSLRKKVRFDISSQHSETAASSPADEMVDGIATTPYEQPSDKSTQQKVAMHIAKHLQTLCFFSLRLKALDEQENFNSDRLEYESQGAVSTGTDSGHDSRLEDVEDQEPLMFEEIEFPPESPQDLLVSWNPRLFVDVLETPERISDLSQMTTFCAPHDLGLKVTGISDPAPSHTVPEVFGYNNTGIYERDMDISNALMGMYGAGPAYKPQTRVGEQDILLDMDGTTTVRDVLGRREQTRTNILNTTQFAFPEIGGNEGGWDLTSWLQDVVE